MKQKFYGIGVLLLLGGLAGCSPMVIDQKDQPPVARISVSCASCQAQYTGYAPLVVNFESASIDDQGIVATLWELGNGTTSTETKVSQTYTQLGTYTVRLTVIDTVGKKTSTELAIKVVEKPIEYKTDRAENEYFVMERIIQDRAYKPGDLVTIKLQITPKRNLEYSYWQEIVPVGLLPDYPKLEFHGYQLKEGKPVAWSYDVLVESPGQFSISGRGQAVDGPNSQELKLGTQLNASQK
jgi:PKD repeat protein